MGQAELWFGAGRGARNAIVVLIGSGVGASLISGGATYRGATSSAAEFGHVTVVVGGRKCRCGSTGCLEAYAGAEAILERYGRPMVGRRPGARARRADRRREHVAARGGDTRRDRAVPGRRDRHPDQLVQSGARHPRRLGRPAARRAAAARHPRVGAAALAAPSRSPPRRSSSGGSVPAWSRSARRRFRWSPSSTGPGRGPSRAKTAEPGVTGHR